MAMDSGAGGLLAPPQFRWNRLLMIAAASAAAVAFCQFNPWFDNAIRNLSTTIALLLTAAGVWIWLLASAGVSRGIKRVLVWTVIGGAALLLLTAKAEYTGNLHIKYVPRQWVLRVFRKAGIDVGDVIHVARLADPPLVLTPSPTDAPQFLGPRGDAIYAEPSGKLARDWSKTPPRELWRVKVGKGWSSFAVVGDYAFTQEETTDDLTELVTCYGLDDGKIRWAHGDPGCYDSSLGGKGPRATPTFFEGKLLSVGGLGQLNCLEAATGKKLWSRNPAQESSATIPDWGVSSSPLVYNSAKHGPIVVVSAGGTNGNSLHAYGLTDGKPVWSVGNDPPGYCSPQLRTIGGVQQVVLVNWQAVTGHDPETGAELWRYEDAMWNGINPKVPQPIVLDDKRVLISAGYGTGCVMLEVTRGSDGKWSVASKWKTNKLKPKFTNLVVRDNHAYGLDDGAFLMCLDLADGDLKWRSSRNADYGHGQVLLVDDLLVVLSETGDLAVVPAEPTKYQELTRTTVLPVGTTWNVPVLIGRKILVRNDLEAALYELPVE